MGGHGGLNILPQKKWNVYNYDNRQIVDRDKKNHADKQRKKYEDNREHDLDNKMSVLKQENGVALPEYRQEVQRPANSLLNQQMKKLADQHKHINLFEEQERILMNREVAELKRLREEDFLKDKNMDYSSKFLGTYNDQRKMPWYSKKKGTQLQKPRNKYYKNLDEVIYGVKTDSRITKQVIQAQKRQQKLAKQEDQRDRTRQKVYKKYEQFEDKCARMEAKQNIAKDIMTYEQELLLKQIKEDKEKDLEKLRQKRLRRQQKERRRIEQLKKKKQNS